MPDKHVYSNLYSSGIDGRGTETCIIINICCHLQEETVYAGFNGDEPTGGMHVYTQILCIVYAHGS